MSVELLNVVLLVEDGRHAGGHALPLLCLGASHAVKILIDVMRQHRDQGCIFRLTCSHPELTEDHVLTSAYVKIFRTVTRNGVNKSV